MLSISVTGNVLVDEAGNVVQLRGVNRMSTDYACIEGFGIFSGPFTTAGNAATLSAMTNGWHVNAVRIPLNEDCWLDKETAGLDPKYLGANYRTAITEWINQITGLGMAAIAELHWNAPAGVRAEDQAAMPDADYSVDFWKSVADTLKGNPLVIFDLHNEPYPNQDVPPPADPWDIWLNGGTVHLGGVSGQSSCWRILSEYKRLCPLSA